ncbi:MAG: beta-phosphoglucomutase [Oscillospiraceae bacterium]
MKYKAIIFDLDGVICHTDKYHYRAWKLLADELGVYFDENINNRLRGVSRMESLDIILERYNGAPLLPCDKVSLANKKNELYKQFLQNMQKSDLSAEVYNTLTSLRKCGLKLAVGSSSKNAKFILERIGLACFFDAISDGNNITRSKPDPEVFLKAAQMLCIEPDACLVVEDAGAGVAAARGCKMDCAGIGDAAQDKNASYCLECFSDLLNIIYDKQQ